LTKSLKNPPKPNQPGGSHPGSQVKRPRKPPSDGGDGCDAEGHSLGELVGKRPSSDVFAHRSELPNRTFSDQCCAMHILTPRAGSCHSLHGAWTHTMRT